MVDQTKADATTGDPDFLGLNQDKFMDRFDYILTHLTLNFFSGTENSNSITAWDHNWSLDKKSLVGTYSNLTL